MYNPFGQIQTTAAPAATGTPAPTPTQPQLPGGSGFGGVFERMGNKRGASKPTGPALTPETGAPYTKMADPARQQLLQSMLMRARGGQAGGAPNAPLPAPNSNIPTA